MLKFQPNRKKGLEKNGIWKPLKIKALYLFLPELDICEEENRIEGASDWIVWRNSIVSKLYYTNKRCRALIFGGF